LEGSGERTSMFMVRVGTLIIVVVSGLYILTPSMSGSCLMTPNRRFTPTSPCRTTAQLLNNTDAAAAITNDFAFMTDNLDYDLSNFKLPRQWFF
jgi:hypothetical protein